jgi:transposase
LIIFIPDKQRIQREYHDKDRLIEALLQERDELYQELSRLRKNDDGALDRAEKKNERYEAVIKEKDDKIKQLTDQMAWYRRKFWKASSEKYIPQDPNQRRIDFDGLDILPQEKKVIASAEKEIIIL